MINALRYALRILKHKWFVLVAGRRLKVPFWNLLVHDLSKFSPSEFGPYKRRFFGGGPSSPDFKRAFDLHVRRNQHHWEYWLIERSRYTCYGHDILSWTDKTGRFTALDMPDEVVREMVADWLAASRAYDGRWPTDECWPWAEKSLDKVRVSPLTQSRVFLALHEAGLPKTARRFIEDRAVRTTK